MSRSVPASRRATETVTVRLPAGTADKLRAATGLPFSTLVRQMAERLLERHVVQQPSESEPTQ